MMVPQELDQVSRTGGQFRPHLDDKFHFLSKFMAISLSSCQKVSLFAQNLWQFRPDLNVQNFHRLSKISTVCPNLWQAGPHLIQSVYRCPISWQVCPHFVQISH